MKHKIAIIALGISWTLSYLFDAGGYVYLYCFLVFFIFLNWGIFYLRLNWFFSSVHQSTKHGKGIALTFDDGPTIFTPLFLDLLQEHRIKASFFCIGQQIEKYPAIFERVLAEGHSVGNHTYSHSHQLGFMSTKKVQFEIEKCDAMIQLYGQIQTDFYRPPFGISNPNIARSIKLCSKKSVGWNVRSLDTLIKDEKKLLNRILKRIRPGCILLMHDTSEHSLQVLKKLIVILKAKGYTFYTINEI